MGTAPRQLLSARPRGRQHGGYGLCLRDRPQPPTPPHPASSTSVPGPGAAASASSQSFSCSDADTRGAGTTVAHSREAVTTCPQAKKGSETVGVAGSPTEATSSVPVGGSWGFLWGSRAPEAIFSFENPSTFLVVGEGKAESRVSQPRHVRPGAVRMPTPVPLSRLASPESRLRCTYTPTLCLPPHLSLRTCLGEGQE